MAKAVNIARSHRLDGIGEYYFSRRLREIAEIEAATGRQIVKLAMGSPDLPPHQSVIDRLAKEAQRPDVHKYMSYKGEPILRKAFADWYKKWYRTELDFKSEVLPLIGSKEGIMHICMTFLNKGDKVLVPNPGYPTYSAAVRLAGGEMVGFIGEFTAAYVFGGGDVGTFFLHRGGYGIDQFFNCGFRTFHVEYDKSFVISHGLVIIRNVSCERYAPCGQIRCNDCHQKASLFFTLSSEQAVSCMPPLSLIHI